MKVLVTGANGYLGGHVLRELLRRGHDLYGLTAHGRRFYGGNLAEFLPHVEAVVHLAWYSSAGNLHDDLQEHCLQITYRVVDLIAESCPLLRQFVFPSTTSVYGDHANREFTENDTERPNCAYTRAKLAAETYLQSCLPHRHLIYRFGSLMGIGVTRTKVDLVVNSAASLAVQGKPIEVWNPQSWKPVLHVKDAASLIAEACERDYWHDVVNAASCSRRAIDIAEEAALLYGAQIKQVDDLSGPRSCSVNIGVLMRALPDLVFRSVREAMLEFQSYRPSQTDKNQPWQYQSILSDEISDALAARCPA